MMISNVPADALIRAAVDAMTARDRQLDAQLPVRSVPNGQEVLAAYPTSAKRRLATPQAVGVPVVHHVAPDHADALWGALHQAELELHWNGNRESLIELLEHWIAETRPTLGDAETLKSWESSYSLKLPARDSAVVQPLLSLGFSVVITEAIRVGLPHADAERTRDTLAALGVKLTQVTLDDAQLLAELDTELLQHESLHGRITRRAAETQLLLSDIRRRLQADPELTWIIESAGEAIGYLSLETSQQHYLDRVAPGHSLAFLQALYLRPGARGAGLGEAVVAFAHNTLNRLGYDRVMLDYAALNPRSGPFWCRMGYRPIWHTWQRRPAG